MGRSLSQVMGLGKLEIIEEEFLNSGLGLHLGCGDVDSCFQRMLLRGEMCQYFCREPTDAKFQGISYVVGATVSSR